MFSCCIKPSPKPYELAQKPKPPSKDNYTTVDSTPSSPIPPPRSHRPRPSQDIAPAKNENEPVKNKPTNTIPMLYTIGMSSVSSILFLYFNFPS